MTRLAFWNAGLTTIRLEDVSRTDPLRIVSREGVQISQINHVRTNSIGSYLHLSKYDQGGWLIEFDYLRPGSGGIFDFTHTKVGKMDIFVTGELLDGNDLAFAHFPRHTLIALVPPSVRRVIGDYWAHRIAIIFEMLTPILALPLVFGGFVPVLPEDPANRLIFVALFVTAFAGQTILEIYFLRTWRVTVPPTLRPFDSSDNP